MSRVSRASVRLRRAADAAVNLALTAKLGPRAALKDLLLLLLLRPALAREPRAADRRLAAVEALRSRWQPSAPLLLLLEVLRVLLPLVRLSARPACSCLPTF